MATSVTSFPGIYSLARVIFYLRTGVDSDPQAQRTLETVRRIRRPAVLFISGMSDGVISPEMTRRLYDATPSSQKALALLPASPVPEHDPFVFHRTEYESALNDFLRPLAK